MDEITAKKIVRKISIILVILWILGLIVSGISSYSEFSSEPAALMAEALYLAITPLVIVGLRSFKKWGLYLVYALSAISFLSSLYSVSIIGVLVWAGVIYDTHRIKEFFR